MAAQRLSDLEETILVWLWRPGEARRSAQDLVRTLAHDKGNPRTLRTLKAKGLITITPGATAAAVALTEAGRERAEALVQGWATALLSWEHGLARLGDCLVQFQRIEEALSLCIAALMGSSRQVGAIVTNEMSFRAKVAVYSALCHHALHVDQLPEDLRQLVARLHWAEQERNTIAHSLWEASETFPETIRREKHSSQRGRFRTTEAHVTPEDLDDLRRRFEGIATDLFYLTAEHLPRLRRRVWKGWRPREP